MKRDDETEPKTWADVAHATALGILQLLTWAVLIGGCLLCNGVRP